MSAPAGSERGWSCADCGSHNLRFSLGTCAGCGKPLDGEPQPTSRTSGMYHRACWNALADKEQK